MTVKANIPIPPLGNLPPMINKKIDGGNESIIPTELIKEAETNIRLVIIIVFLMDNRGPADPIAISRLEARSILIMYAF